MEAAQLTRILSVLCAAHLCSASPVLRSVLVVQSGQNVSLPCNLTSSGDIINQSSDVITWYVLRSDQLLPLLTVSLSKFGEEEEVLHGDSSRRHGAVGRLQNGSSRLRILQVEETDAGLYFCSGRCEGAAVCVSAGLRLSVGGAGESSALQLCWTLGICVLPASLVLCVVIMLVSYLCSGKSAGCCCAFSRRLNLSEDESLNYSSLKLAGRPRPPAGRGGTRLVQEDVTYSAVANRKSPHGSHDHR